MSDTVWSYRDSDWSQDRDLVGYEVEADGGSIGKVDQASTDAAAQWLVVDTGFWIFGKKRVIPAGTVVGMDHESRRIVVSMTKDQVKAAPGVTRLGGPHRATGVRDVDLPQPLPQRPGREGP